MNASGNFRTHAVYLVKGSDGFSVSDMFLPEGEDISWIEKSAS
ncbi:MAG TPA: hypothetical protein VLF20_04625 [Patescibacteria group bacterium]|nr:hypothetical protein [Patescibacteria group bacterium]